MECRGWVSGEMYKSGMDVRKAEFCSLKSHVIGSTSTEFSPAPESWLSIVPALAKVRDTCHMWMSEAKVLAEPLP